jgi:hypothetical protein
LPPKEAKLFTKGVFCKKSRGLSGGIPALPSHEMRNPGRRNVKSPALKVGSRAQNPSFGPSSPNGGW